MTVRTDIGQFGAEFEILGGEIKLVGGAGGSVAALTDVDLTGLADDDFLQYDVASGKWLPVPAPNARAFFLRMM